MPKPLTDERRAELVRLIGRDEETVDYFLETMCHLVGADPSQRKTLISKPNPEHKDGVAYWWPLSANFLANEILPAAKRLHVGSMDSFSVRPIEVAELLRTAYGDPGGEARGSFGSVRADFREMVAGRVPAEEEEVVEKEEESAGLSVPPVVAYAAAKAADELLEKNNALVRDFDRLSGKYAAACAVIGTMRDILQRLVSYHDENPKEFEGKCYLSRLVVQARAGLGG